MAKTIQQRKSEYQQRQRHLVYKEQAEQLLTIIENHATLEEVTQYLMDNFRVRMK